MTVDRLQRQMRGRSAVMLRSLKSNLDQIVIWWLFLAMAACGLRLAFGATAGGGIEARTLLPYALIVLAPGATLVLALRWFADGPQMAQPSMRFARVGRWVDVPNAEARRRKLFGPRGLMLSLLLGILLNIPLRSAEFLVSLPAVNSAAPDWLFALHSFMALNVVLLSSLYALAFVAALRCVPLFPRILVTVWCLDLAMQLSLLKFAGAPAIPGPVAEPLQALLEGNVRRVLISASIWFPYLLLSKRVNLTYRRRVKA